MAQVQKNIIHPVTSKPAPVSRFKLTAKVTDKGGLSVYGLQRFPVTLYREQWEALLDHADKIRAFMDANSEHLAVKETQAADSKGRTSL
jgi:hypothetical protein